MENVMTAGPLIPILTSLSTNEFCKYYEETEPFVLKNFCSWPAVKRWDFDYFRGQTSEMKATWLPMGLSQAGTMTSH